MGDIRKRYDGYFKAKMALLAIKGAQTIEKIASKYSIHPNQISRWKKQAIDALPGIFSKKLKK